ncbi:MAG: 2-amino-4-hydroxy-6-hydroxymethyldihydropteridine diphosphokinase [Epsilonproteobacteria bacterium]|nr:2-amino-4-hydroxy-6-hydroxymethyldihydropteridine diphosphokinase [Campylobacterota bacterium]
MRIRGGSFGYTQSKKSNRRYEVVVGIGGNVGDVKRRFEHLFYFLKRDKRVELLQTSSILKNPPFGYLEQEDFLNAVMVLQTSMQPKSFLDFLHRVEKRFGRVRLFQDAPRTLDLDIIFFGNKKMKSERLTIPHKSWFERESVILPLTELYRV